MLTPIEGGRQDQQLSGSVIAANPGFELLTTFHEGSRIVVDRQLIIG